MLAKQRVAHLSSKSSMQARRFGRYAHHIPVFLLAEIEGTKQLESTVALLKGLMCVQNSGNISI
jgi:hypothetical protein